jgi:Domain of unknown function (DUF1772)
MALKVWQLTSIALSAFVAGMFGGPWVALSRSMSAFTPEVFLAIVDRLNRNMAPVMTILMPAALLSVLPVLFLTRTRRPMTFYANIAGLALFLAALLVTMLVEVPIVKQIETWTVSTLPGDWERLRDRWGVFHVVRVVAGTAGFVLLLVGAIL